MAGIKQRIGTFRVLVGRRGGKSTLEDPGIDGRIILEWIFNRVGVDWIGLFQDRDRWRALVNMVP